MSDIDSTPKIAQPTVEDAASKAARVKKITVRLGFDVWDEDGNRLAAGEVHDLPEDLAQSLMDEKKAEYAGRMVAR